MDEEYDSYRTLDPHRYAGRWIAVEDDAIIAEGKDLYEVYHEVQRRHPGASPFYTQILDEDEIEERQREGRSARTGDGHADGGDG